MLKLTLVLAVALLLPQASTRAAMIAEVIKTGSMIVAGVTFDRGQQEPTAGSDAALGELRAVLLEHTEWTFEVQVHTNETDAAVSDQSLSASRAAGVVRWLTSRGIAPERLVARGYGSSRPLPRPPDSDPSLQHRRVELRKLNEE